MMFLPSMDGFVTQLQETGTAVAGITGSDDIAITIPALIALVGGAGLKVRVFVKDKDTLHVEVKP